MLHRYGLGLGLVLVLVLGLGLVLVLGIWNPNTVDIRNIGFGPTFWGLGLGLVLGFRVGFRVRVSAFRFRVGFSVGS